MQALQTLIRNLAIILLLATFLEMLLPNKAMRGYVRLVMGLFVISAILNPLADFLHLPLALNIPAWTAASPQDVPVLAAEGQGNKLGRDAVLAQYRQILQHQIEALALGVKGVDKANVTIDFANDGGGLIEQPPLAKVSITLFTATTNIRPIRPIVIDGSRPAPPHAPAGNPLVQEVQNRVSTLMEIDPAKVDVEIAGPN
ncbi:Stage III sporulation protein AF (Spore_III_AF) [Acididesulfobacillus acetoxydans]|uniref:Stage III sporulation protein AF (Spore III AF) n=1 Tax=Acididesulfobacillus acetoxydans TaxID=1561005 RepID=A0A8S0Y3J4_9FIRM|nr:stage III sporulation protein AF [Acididesulfobacillus acetoxydans]CAA7602135.1 Stage III sporulation protein AF (Spore_III_AF) [Acididesulfobacillus acetoxydans]CEJ08022.1 Stage III sporulation protein AF (Spore III AF) [Acididesulfobacillus acetoxydans]